MRFTVAWAKVASENSILKTVVLILSGLCLVFAMASLKLALKDAIVIERSCYSKSLPNADGKRTPSEIEGFLKEALAQRFDTTAPVIAELLSNEEQLIRLKEQKDLQARNLTQRVLVNSILVNGGEVVVDADRLISVGDVRSAFKFPLTISIESVTRSEGNPYGLVVARVKANESGEKK